MKKTALLLLLSFKVFFVFSQDFYENYEELFASFSEKHEYSIKELKKWGFRHYFDYNKEELDSYKDSLEILKKIHFVNIKTHKDIKLEEIVNNLTVCPNIEMIKFGDNIFFNSDTAKVTFPKNLHKLHKLKTLIFNNFNNWDYDKGFQALKNVKSLEGIALYSFSSNILMNKYLRELKLKNVMYCARNAPQIPKDNHFENFILKCDYYKDKSEQFLKNLSETKLKKFHFEIWYDTINAKVVRELKHLRNLEKLTIGSPVKDSNLVLEIFGKNNPKITELKLINCNLNELPEGIKHFKNLENFYSSNNRIKKIAKSFYTLKKIKHIDIQGADLEKLDDNLGDLENLRVLNIYYNRLKSIPKTIGNLILLDSLSINDNQLEKLPKSIGNLTHLKYLDIGTNQLDEIPNSICKLRNLNQFKFDENYIKKLPKDIGKLKNLKDLTFSNNLISVLPKSFIELENLTFLDITANDITHLPENFGNLKKLKILNADANFLKTLPESFGELSSLERIKLSHNNLSELPKSFGNLTNLKVLYLNNKKNHRFDFEKYNHISGRFEKDTLKKRIPRTINQLKGLPKSFSKLNNLETIDVSSNHNISEDIFDILKKCNSKKYSLDLEDCHIEKLPENGWKNFYVKYLNVSNNKIIKLPKDIKNAPYLTTLDITDNSEKLDTYRGNKAQISLLLMEQGILSENELPKTDEMAIAYAEIANKKGYSSTKDKYEQIIKFANKAIKINKKLALEKLHDDNIVEALYKTKNYKDCIRYADIAIKKDTSSHIRFLNSIVPNFKYQINSYLKLKDTLRAFETLKVFSKNFDSYGSWDKTGILAKKLNDPNYKQYFENQINNYKEAIKAEPNSFLNHLSLLEIYIIAGQHKEAVSYYEKLKTLLKEPKYTLLNEYLNFVLKIATNNYSEEDLKFMEYKIQNEKEKIEYWSFELLLFWNESSSLSNKQKQDIKNITNLYSKP